jgi:putative Holliday junction resolvase
MRYLGIDYGKKRVGLALSDESGRLAFPHSVLPNDKHLVAEIARIAKEQKVKAIVVGESKDLSGKANPLMKDIEVFVQAVHKEAKKPVHLEPEFWSSFQAARWQGKTDKLDASAAAIILQSYLDRQ